MALSLLDRWRPERSHRSSNPYFEGSFASQNVVSTVTFVNGAPKENEDRIAQKRIITHQGSGNEIPLSQFCAHADFLSHQPSCFCAATCRIEDTATQVFKRGTCVVVGLPTMSKVYWAAHTMRFYLRDKAKVNLHLQGILLRNRVCSCHMNFAIDIHNFQSHDYIGNVKQPDSFPGIMYKHTTESGDEFVCLLFETGSCIVTGLPYKEGDEEIQKAYDSILPLMLRNKKATADTSRGQQRAVRKFTKQIENILNPVSRKRGSEDDDPDDDDDENIIDKIVQLSEETFPGNRLTQSRAKRQRTKK